jgi:hypothetical protein
LDASQRTLTEQSWSQATRFKALLVAAFVIIRESDDENDDDDEGLFDALSKTFGFKGYRAALDRSSRA